MSNSSDNFGANSQADSGFNKENTSLNDQKESDEDLNIDDGDEIDEDEDDEDDDDDENDTEDDDEDEETEEESSDSDQENQIDSSEKGTELKPPLSPNSIPTCYICLNEFEGQDVGSPDSCENFHHFCLECIEEWSKQINTCPVDRKLFSFIIVRRDVNGEVIMKVPVKKSSVVEIETMEEDVTYCEICGRCDREDRLLLCDGCDFGYHCECLDPPLETIPIDEWFCPECFDRLFSDDVRQETYMRQSTSQRRAIARTGTFEIVRNRILARRTTQQRNQSSTPRPKKRKTKRRRKTRKTSKKTTTSTKKRKTRKRRKSKKRTRKSKMSSRRLPSANQQIRNRIASKLGLGPKPKSPFGLPAMKPNASNKSISENRYSAGIGNLSMFGYELELNNPRSYDNDFEMEASISGSVGLLARARNHISAPFSKSVKSPKVIFNMSSTNILGEIMTSQEILHASQSDLTISRNGVVYLKTDPKSNIRKCPDSNSQSSSSNGSPSQNNSDANGNNNNNNNNFSNKSNYYNEKSENLSESDISLIKPSPVVALPEDRPDIELYSDIESIGDNKEDNEDEDKSKVKKSNAKDLNHNTEQKDQNNQLKSDAAETTNNEMANTINETISSDKVDGERLPRRRPSIKDLFGGDSDEEDDELKKLVAQQGSINVHYPIKMPIVLKTNFLTENKTNNYSQELDEVPISKKWIPIYPETDKVKITGPKWKAIGFNSEKKSSRILEDEENDNDRSIHVEYSDKLVKDSQPQKPVGNDSAKKALKRIVRDVDLIENKQIDYGVSKKTKLEIELKPSTSTHAETKTKISSGTDSKVDSRKKVRVCKHGRVIVKDSDKKRTSPPDVVSNKKIKDEVKSHDRLGSDTEQENDVNWKKLSSSSKMRNYRDGKQTGLLYMDRQPKVAENFKIEKSMAYKDDKVLHRDSKTRERHRDHHRSDDMNRSSILLKSSSSKSSHNNTNKSSKATDSKSRENEKLNSRVTSLEDKSKNTTSKESKSHKHRHHHKHKHNSENHHRHRHSKKSSHVDKHHKHLCHHSATSSTSNPKNDNLQKASTYETYPVIKTLNSKEIYTEGDKIIINVNFKKEESISKPESKKKSKPDKIRDSDTERNVSNKNNVEILSPQSVEDNNYSNSLDHSDHSILSPIFTEDYKSKMNESLKEVLSEEFKFLPKIIQTNNNHNSTHGPRTPDHYLDDSFLPTPTQDESQSPILNRINKQNHPSSIQSTSPIETKDDFYDPELPLQSPDHNSIKSPSKDKFESAASPKDLQMEKGDNASLTQSNMASTSSLASTVAKATATLASLNSFNLAQLIEIAKNFKNQSSDKHKSNQSSDNNRDIIEIVDMDVDSPSPNSSPLQHKSTDQSSISNVKEIWDQIVKTASARLNNNNTNNNNNNNNNGNGNNNFNNGNHLVEQKKYSHSMLDQPPTSAVDMEIKEKYIKKLNRQERVVEEVKLSLKPHYQKKRITKDDYKEILRKAVPKICHSRSGEINPQKIKKLVEAYVKRYRYMRKKDAQAGKL